jgi:hypothetical protein
VKKLLPLILIAACSQGRNGGSGAPSPGGALDGGISTESPEPDPADLAQAPFDPDASCAVATETASVDYLPVDIIWVIDNSNSMAPAIAQVTSGLNSFAQSIAGKSLDYKIIMLSLRAKTNPITVGGSTRWGVCIPPPLSGDNDCGNGARFFQSSVDIKSTQPLEQFLGTLGQTAGYQPGDARGGDPWKAELRANATKTIVVLSDDNSRLSATDFETFAGGKNPFNSTTLPPGILDASWGGLFSGYTFDGLYGWGSLTDPSVKCTYSDGTQPPASGATYTTLVGKTNGVRAHICDPATAWSMFFDAIAQAVAKSSKLTCDLAIPTPSQGTLDPSAINVTVDGATSTTLYKVANAAACGAAGGWYYDNDAAPSRVLLCPASCDFAQQQVTGAAAKISIHFGCKTLIQ